MINRALLYLLTLVSTIGIETICLAKVSDLNLPTGAATYAKTGKQFHEYLCTLPPEKYDDAVYQAFTSGNVPNFLRSLQPVNISYNIDGQTVNATYYVTSDYICVGNDKDYYRLPMSPILAQKICNATSTTLPTRKMVNDIWAAAACKLPPQPIPPDNKMATEPRFWEHQLMVQETRSTNTAPMGSLVGGNKKDVVITMRLKETHHPTPRVFIYGWHRANGLPIQPLSAAHENTYKDYSHGIRLVANTMTVNNETTTVQAILQNPKLSGLLSDEGVFEQIGLSYPLEKSPTSTDKNAKEN